MKKENLWKKSEKIDFFEEIKKRKMFFSICTEIFSSILLYIYEDILHFINTKYYLESSAQFWDIKFEELDLLKHPNYMV